MGTSNRHGGARVSRRLKVLFNGQPGRHNVFRNYFGVKKSALDAAATGTVSGTPSASSSTPTEQK
ncbi:MAG: hypothetical protein IT381_16935 [Deltaproteobacteria bacterium]|nr:hypothetical protein [Deltaproteobacteria bacterium]